MFEIRPAIYAVLLTTSVWTIWAQEAPKLTSTTKDEAAIARHRDPSSNESIAIASQRFQQGVAKFGYGYTLAAPPQNTAAPWGAEAAYPASELNAALTKAKSSLLAAIPSDAKPTRKYIEDNFPDKLEGVSPTESVDMRQCGPLIQKAKSILGMLTASSSNPDPLYVDLSINTNNNSATFKVTSSSGDSYTTPTVGTLRLPRGQYSYHVVKDGQKPIDGPLDLFMQPGNQLMCTFVAVSSSDAAGPCRLSDSN